MATAPVPITTGYRAGIKQDDVTTAYGIETAWGTPATTGQILRVTSNSLSAGEQTKSSNEFDGTRSAAPMFRTSLEAGGSLGGEFSAGTLDDFIACVMSNVWTNGVLQDGSGGSAAGATAATFLTIDSNLGGIQWHQYSGCFVQKLTITMTTESIVTWTADIIAKNQTLLTAEPFTTIKPISTSGVMKFGPTLTGKVFNGSVIPSILDSLTLTIENTGATRQYGDGTFGAVGIDIGTFTYSGSFSVYFNNASLYAAFQSQTIAPLSFTIVDDGNNGYAFNAPAARLMTPTQPISGRGKDLMQTYNFQAQKDTNGNTLQITRGPVAGLKGSFSYTGT